MCVSTNQIQSLKKLNTEFELRANSMCVYITNQMQFLKKYTEFVVRGNPVSVYVQESNSVYTTGGNDNCRSRLESVKSVTTVSRALVVSVLVL